MRLADAYGIRDRVEFGDSRDHGAANVVDVDRRNNGGGADSASTGLNWRLVAHSDGTQRNINTFAELIGALDVNESLEIGGPPSDPIEIEGSERIAVLTNVPNHYRVPLWNELSRRYRQRGIELRIFFTAGAPARRPWVRHPKIEFDHCFLRNGVMGFPTDLRRRLRDFKPTLVLSGGFSPVVTGQAGSRSGRSPGCSP